MPPAKDVLLGSTKVDERQLAREEEFFRRLKLQNGTYKTTARNRMPELDLACAELLRGTVGVRILDMGVSSGVTTADLLQVMAQYTDIGEMVAADLTAHASLRQLGALGVLYDESGYVLQVAVGGNARGRPHDAGKSVQSQSVDLCMRGAGRLLQWLGVPPVPLPLMSARLRGAHAVRFVSQDVFVRNAGWEGHFDLVRVANLLNRAYFSEAQLQQALAHAIEYVKPMGYLLVNRSTDDGFNHGTILQRQPQGHLSVVQRFGSGSEVEALMVAATGAGGGSFAPL
ncbi:hypothetical protein GEMMAAP_03545 [Gemmatimonas phototrophica]|uniref:Methyltransferase domain-containing protein n=2 Tax=Gemmatimonas phototrophica TaxID=1379270 RepID=A0A143BGH6_9BACT|nr:hypothetical protein GEMMAAP_03545 [Gemmatimonas phototrophica]